MNRLYVLAIVCFGLLTSTLWAEQVESAPRKAERVVRLVVPDMPQGAPVRHAIKRLTDVLKKRGVHLVPHVSGRTSKVLIAGVSSKSLMAKLGVAEGEIKLPEQPESLAVKRFNKKDEKRLVVIGYDDVGLMYALLDIADYVESLPDDKVADWFETVPEVSEAPCNKMRR
ncbi:MAG: hypothetical protein PVH19_07050, partial [Planctomycetia bacterium]